MGDAYNARFSFAPERLDSSLDSHNYIISKPPGFELFVRGFTWTSRYIKQWRTGLFCEAFGLFFRDVCSRYVRLFKGLAKRLFLNRGPSAR